MLYKIVPTGEDLLIREIIAENIKQITKALQIILMTKKHIDYITITPISEEEHGLL